MMNSKRSQDPFSLGKVSLVLIKKTKRLSTVHDEHNNGPMHTSFVMLVDDQVPIHTNGHYQDTSENDLKINTKKHKQNNDGKIF